MFTNVFKTEICPRGASVAGQQVDAMSAAEIQHDDDGENAALDCDGRHDPVPPPTYPEPPSDPAEIRAGFVSAATIVGRRIAAEQKWL